MKTPLTRTAKLEARDFALDYVTRVMAATASMGPLHYAPLRITLTLSSPTILTHPWLSFDALTLALMLPEFSADELFHVWQRKFSFDQAIIDAINILRVKDSYPWPILRNQTTGLQHASVSIFEPQSIQARTVVLFKRFETFHAPTGTRKQKVARGMEFYRDYAMNFVCLPANKITFYAMAFPPMMERLLPTLLGIGTHFRVGFGAVQGWKIEQLTEDQSITWNGIAMRPIPVRLLAEWEDSAMLAWHPPYWGSDSVEECAVPFTPVRMAEQPQQEQPA